MPNLPQGAGQLPGKGHWTRDIAFSRDGKRMYVSVGSYSNVQRRTARTKPAAPRSWPSIPTARTGGWSPPASAIRCRWRSRRSTARCGPRSTSATGSATTSSPTTSPPCQQGQFYGWPWFYIGAQPGSAAGQQAARPAYRQVTVPKVLLQAHSASLGSAFYTGKQFPAEYRGSLFVAEHGSWNRSNPTGSKVIRLIFDGEGNAAPLLRGLHDRLRDLPTTMSGAGRSASRSAGTARSTSRRTPTVRSTAFRTAAS